MRAIAAVPIARARHRWPRARRANPITPRASVANNIEPAITFHIVFDIVGCTAVACAQSAPLRDHKISREAVSTSR
jgi:hypothetical protein